MAKVFQIEAMAHKLFYVAAISLLLLFNFNYQGRSSNKAPSFYLSPIKYEYFHFGYKSLLADVLWLRLLPDIDTVIPLEGNANTWQYGIVDTVTNLAPTFRAAYRNGGDVLSVVLDDTDGATKIFEKGIAVFPTYWPLLYSAAFHFMEEEKDPKRAAELLLLASKHGGPEWFVSLAGKLYSEAGQKELAIRSLLDYLKRFPEGDARERVLQRLSELGVNPPLHQ